MANSIITIAEAKHICMQMQIQEIEQCAVVNAIGRTISQPIFSQENMPPFNKSAVDGYACKFSELSKELQCVATVNAGTLYTQELMSGECVKIMTGAPVPMGADCVFMYEDAEIKADGAIVCVNQNSKRNICKEGEDVSVGDSIISKDTILNAQHAAILSAFGITEVEVYKQAAVAIIATGTELVEPHMRITNGQIRNSNSTMLLSIIPQAQYVGIIPDEYAITKTSLQKVFETHDVVIVTGGASDSEYDLLPKVIKELGFNTLVRKIAMQPGKPCLVAKKDNKICFGLSGNPVSAFVQCMLFVKPFLRLAQPNIFALPLLHDFSRKKSDRVLFVPAIVSQEGVATVSYNGSAHIAAFAQANCLIEIPVNCKSINKGELVYVRQF